MLMCVASNFDLSNSSIAATDDICFQTNLCAYNFLKILTRETPTIWLSLKVVTMLPNDGPLLPPQTQRRRRATTSRRAHLYESDRQLFRDRISRHADSLIRQDASNLFASDEQFV